MATATAGPLRFGELLWTLVRTDFKGRYHGSASGFLWALCKPLVMFVVLLAVFSFIFARQPDYRLNLIVGLFLWDFFSESTRVGLTSLHAKGYLLSKARFPSWVVVAAAPANALLTMLLFVVILSGYLGLSGRPPSPLALVLFVLYVACLLAIVIGFALGTSVLFLRYRDLNQFWDVALQAGFFLAPIVYPLAILPERFHRYLYLWPPTPIIQFSRAVLVSDSVPSLRAHLYLLLGTSLIFGSGALIFRRYAPRAAELL
ncbi:MAG TPA: ABC transporter permease [Thermoanaerobaculia bacterium]|nr:ABC transporter permease [Thermoanaerobaculia bacterium]